MSATTSDPPFERPWWSDRRFDQAARRWVQGAAGVLILVAIWQVLASTQVLGRYALPTPAAVASTEMRDGFYAGDAFATLWEAARGWVAGNLVALGMATLTVVWAGLRRPVLRIAVASYCVPTIAIGPILVLLMSLDQTKVVMAALAVFFTSLVALIVGFESADPRHLDVIHAYGGSRWAALRKVRLRAALPAAVSGLALAAPAAVLGAMIGDYLGGHRGLGVVMLQAEASVHTARVWAVGITATALAGAWFALISFAARRLSGGATIGSLDARPLSTAPAGRRPWLSLGCRVAALLGTLAALVLLWWAAVVGLGLNPYYAKTPIEVLQGLSIPQAGMSTGHALLTGAGRTLAHAAYGYLAGTLAAVLLAAAVTSLPVVRSMVMPAIMALRAVPLIAMTPLLALIFGTGGLLIAVIAGIVVLVPTVVTVVAGLGAIPPASEDVFHAYGARRLAILLKLRGPYAIPALFAAARVAMPGAVLGAVLAEWLLANAGLGHLMAIAVIDSNFVLLWGALAIATLISVVLYHLMSEGEELTIEWLRQ
jgi:ABC-type nitrate/sulfonate/bicarbonate transport system permease component